MRGQILFVVTVLDFGFVSHCLILIIVIQCYLKVMWNMMPTLLHQNPQVSCSESLNNTFNNNTSMTEMADCTPFSRSNSFNTPLEESIEVLVRALFIPSLVAPNECFQLGEKLLDRIQIRRVWW